MQADNFLTGNSLDHRLHRGSGNLDQMASDLLEKMPPFFARQCFDQVLLGCGSTEVLRCADTMFLGASKNVVVSEPTYEAVLSFA